MTAQQQPAEKCPPDTSGSAPRRISRAAVGREEQGVSSPKTVQY